MEGTNCKKCGSVFFPPRDLCPTCRRSGHVEKIKLSGEGVIISYTIIRSPPEGFEGQTPYAIAIIKLNEGASIAGQVIGDLKSIETGRRVRPVFRKIHEDGPDGAISYGFKFALAE